MLFWRQYPKLFYLPNSPSNHTSILTPAFLPSLHAKHGYGSNSHAPSEYTLSESRGEKGDTISRIKFLHSGTKRIFARIAFLFQYYTRKFIYKTIKRLPHLKKVHVNTFPAVHLKKLDGFDFTVKFSSELIVLALTGVAALLNFYFFTLIPPDEYSDNSILAKVLSEAPSENPRLHAKLTTVKTVVAGNNSFITSARAENLNEIYLPTLDTASAPDDEFANNVLSQPTPDSVDGLLAKQIKVYETKGGDTLKSVSDQFGISPQTVAWANKLPNTTIKPGWFLVILPTDGVLHKATSNDTLPDIAKRYGASVETIIAYNGLENAEDIDQDQLIIVPGGRIPDPPKPKPQVPATPSKNDGKVNPQGSTKPSIINNGAGHIFPWGYCTWYVATQVHVPWGGNAKNWLTNARSYGAVITNEPSVGSIVVTTDNARYGHVALVKKVEADRFLVSEMNYIKFGKVNERWININSKTVRGFILP
jgi:surface antigen